MIAKDADPDRARAILDAAGWRTGVDGIRAKARDRLSLRFVVQAGKGDDELAQQVIIAALQAVGIEARADNRAGVAYRQARYKGDFDLLYSAWVTGADPIYSRFFGSGGANNSLGYANPALDAVLARMEGTLDPAARKAAAFEMQRILSADLPTIPLTTNIGVVTKRRALKGFTPNPTNMTPFVGAAFWRLEP